MRVALLAHEALGHFAHRDRGDNVARVMRRIRVVITKGRQIVRMPHGAWDPEIAREAETATTTTAAIIAAFDDELLGIRERDHQVDEPGTHARIVHPHERVGVELEGFFVLEHGGLDGLGGDFLCRFDHIVRV